jgi:hypothetical protein
VTHPRARDGDAEEAHGPAVGSAAPGGVEDGWWRKGAREAPGLAAIAAVVVCAFAPLATMGMLLVDTEGITNRSDMLNSAYPFRLLLGQALAQGHLPLWTDQIFCGYPLLADPAVGTFYPLNWLFAFLPGAAAMGVVIIVTCMMAGWLTYLYCRTVGLGRPAATLGGMSFAVCGFFVGHARQPALIGSACWLPLQLTLVEKAVRGARGASVRCALWMAPVMALAVLAGGLQIAYISALAVAAYALFRLGKPTRRDLGWRLALGGLLAVAMGWGLVLAAQQLVPTAELSRVSERAAGLPLSAADPRPIPAQDLLTLVSAGAVGRAADFSYYRRNPRPGFFWEDYAYVGWPVALLALAGLPWSLRKRAAAPLLVALAGGGIWLALGERGRLFPIAFDVIPGMRLFRVPERFLLWTQFAAAALGAMGANAALGFLRGRGRAAAAAVLVALTLADLGLNQGRQHVYYRADAWTDPPPTVRVLRRSTSISEQPRVHSVWRSADREYFTALFSRGGWEAHRGELWADRAGLRPSANAIWGIRSEGGYAELVPEWTAVVWGGQHTLSLTAEADRRTTARAGAPAAEPPPGYLELLGAGNVRFVLSRWPLKAPALQEIPTPGYHVYRNLKALSRAYLVPGAADVRSDAGFYAQQTRAGLDYSHRVYVNGAAPPPVAEFTAIPVAAHDTPELTQVMLRPRAPAACWLVLTDAYYPGWSVTVDGRPAALVRANCAMRAVELWAGAHRVEFQYRSRPLKLGCAAAAAGGLVWLLALLWLPARVGPRRATGGAQASRCTAPCASRPSADLGMGLQAAHLRCGAPVP